MKRLMISPRSRRFLLRCGDGVLALIALITAMSLFALLRPLPEWKPPDMRLDPPAAPSTQPTLNTLSDLAAIWQRNLRQPLSDAPVPSAAAPTENPPPLQLVGTAVEAQRRFAIFSLPNQSLVVREVGATIEGYELVDVGRGRAQLRRAGREFELRVPWYDRIELAREGTP